MLDALGIQEAGKAKALVARVIPLARAENDSHVIEAPRIGQVRQVMIRAVEVDVVVVITVEEVADLVGAAQADEISDQVRMPKGDVCRVISGRGWRRKWPRDALRIPGARNQRHHV